MKHEAEIQEAFSPDQRAKLAVALNLESETEIDNAVFAVVGTILAHHVGVAAKARNPDRVKSKRKLRQIADAARKLRILLADFDVSNSFGNVLKQSDFFPPEVAKIFNRRPLWSDEETSIRDMFGMLQNIDLNATLMAEDDRSYSFYHMLPTMETANREFDASALWPRLFKYWEMAGHKVAATPDGPTFRFLSLIHEVAELEPPKLGSLRSACERWRADPMRSQDEAIPWRE